VRDVIKGAASKQVQTCYERGLKGNNLLQGSMEVELTIGASGTVRAVSVDGTLRDRQVHSCVKRVARTWKFPRPTGGCVRINVPFQMTPKL
jgi:TonB family protein